MNKSTYNKVAVVTSASTVMGVSIIKKLSAEGYFVFACLDGRPDSSANLDTVRDLPGVKTLYIEISTSSAWRRICTSIERMCVEEGLEPHVDLLVNIPTLANGNVYASIPEYELELTLREGVLKTYGAVQVLLPLLKISDNANIVNIYPQSRHDYSNDLVSAITLGALDSFTVSLATLLSQDNVKVNAIRPNLFGGHGLYETGTLDVIGLGWTDEIVEALDKILADAHSLTGRLYTVTSEASDFTLEVGGNA